MVSRNSDPGAPASRRWRRGLGRRRAPCPRQERLVELQRRDVGVDDRLHVRRRREASPATESPRWPPSWRSRRRRWPSGSAPDRRSGRDREAERCGADGPGGGSSHGAATHGPGRGTITRNRHANTTVAVKTRLRSSLPRRVLRARACGASGERTRAAALVDVPGALARGAVAPESELGLAAPTSSARTPLRLTAIRRDHCGHLGDPASVSLRATVRFGSSRHAGASGSRSAGGDSSCSSDRHASGLEARRLIVRLWRRLSLTAAGSSAGTDGAAPTPLARLRSDRAAAATGSGRRRSPRVQAPRPAGSVRLGFGLLEGAPHRVDDPVVGGAGPCARRPTPPSGSESSRSAASQSKSESSRSSSASSSSAAASRGDLGLVGVRAGRRPSRTRPRPARSRRSDRSSWRSARPCVQRRGSCRRRVT